MNAIKSFSRRFPRFLFFRQLLPFAFFAFALETRDRVCSTLFFKKSCCVIASAVQVNAIMTMFHHIVSNKNETNRLLHKLTEFVGCLLTKPRRNWVLKWCDGYRLLLMGGFREQSWDRSKTWLKMTLNMLLLFVYLIKDVVCAEFEQCVINLWKWYILITFLWRRLFRETN